MIIEAWSLIRQRRGTAPALLNESGEVLRSFSTIEEEARLWQERLEAQDAGEGEVLALQAGNHPATLAVVLAGWRLGLVVVLLGLHVGDQERVGVLETTGATLLVTRREGGGIVEVERIGPRRALWEGEARPALLKLTSGTTAAPRVIRFRQEALLEDGLQICETMGISSDDLNYGVIPISHSYGFSNLVTPLLACGVPMVLSEDRMPRAILNGLRDTGATVFPGMPIFFDKLAALESEAGLPQLRLAISAGAPLTPEVGQRFTRRFGVKIHTFYGSSECGGIGYDRETTPDYREGFVGQPLSRIALHRCAEGRFRVEGRTVGDGYWSALGPVDQGGFHGGSFAPDDLLREEAEGFYLAGRESDMINIAGRKLNPREVEARLMEFPGVREVVVFGIPSPLRNEEAIACISSGSGREPDRDALIRFARKQLSGWQVPKDFWFTDEIPRNERGKINRRELAKVWQTMRQ